MENKIIDITAEVVKPDTNPTDNTLKLIDELNQKVANKNGEWIYSNEHGVVWKPKSGPHMPSSEPTKEYHLPEEKTPPPLLESIIQWGKSYDFDNLPQNSVVLIKLNISDPMRVNMMQRIIAKQVLEPKIEVLKKNRICILFMQAEDDIQVMTEEDMSKAGWEKKEKKRIITLS